jgi:hypothetical protein
MFVPRTQPYPEQTDPSPTGTSGSMETVNFSLSAAAIRSLQNSVAIDQCINEKKLAKLRHSICARQIYCERGCYPYKNIEAGNHFVVTSLLSGCISSQKKTFIMKTLSCTSFFAPGLSYNNLQILQLCSASISAVQQ